MLYPLFGSLRLPKLRYVRERFFSLSGIKVRFAMPPMSTKWGTQEEFADKFNLYDKNDYVRKDKDVTPFISCFSTEWDAKGVFFFQEDKGAIPLYVAASHWKGGGNLFRPRDMEDMLEQNEIRRYTNTNKFPGTVKTFLDWRPVTINGNQWLHYTTETDHGRVAQMYLWRIPVTDQHFLTFSFPTENHKERPGVDEAMKAFCSELMQSVRIEWPEHVLQMKADAAKQWPDEHYSAHKEPLIWEREDKGLLSLEEYLDECEARDAAEAEKEERFRQAESEADSKR